MPVRFHNVVFVIAFVVFGITAFNSKGYYHFDEHYQIIEFASLKLGKALPEELPWEYGAQIRPTLQPVICMLVFKLLSVFGIDNPYTLTFSLRVLSMLLALMVIRLFVHSTGHYVDARFQKLYIVLSYLLWFLPFLNVRFSSENWSGLFCLLALAVLPRKQWVLTGFLLGLCFVFRFQAGFLLVGLFAWLLIVQKESWKNLAKLAGGAAAAELIFGIGIDRWFYGNFVLAPWRYYESNIINDIAASRFGSSPWYYYMEKALMMPIAPIGGLILLCLLVLLIRQPRLLVIWLVVPFLIGYSITAHKEERYLFQVANLVPFITILGLQEAYRYFSKHPLLIRSLGIIGVLLLLVNGLAIVVMASRGLRYGAKDITSYIHSHYKNEAVQLIYEPGVNPYNPVYPLKEVFYRKDSLREINMDEFYGLVPPVINSKQPIVFVLPQGHLNDPEHAAIIKKYQLQPRMQSVPAWVAWLNRFYYDFKQEDVMVLYTNK